MLLFPPFRLLLPLRPAGSPARAHPSDHGRPGGDRRAGRARARRAHGDRRRVPAAGRGRRLGQGPPRLREGARPTCPPAAGDGAGLPLAVDVHVFAGAIEVDLLEVA